MRSRARALTQHSIVSSMLAMGLCASMQLVGPLHHLLVAHYHCAAHGELTHAASGHEHDHHEQLGGEAAEVPAISISQRSPEHASHEHCAIATHERSQALIAEAAWAPLAGPARADVQRVPQLPWVVTDAPIDSAPKASPPIAG